jgi:predicted phosphate transport protein (TIGR00153 family)
MFKLFNKKKESYDYFSSFEEVSLLIQQTAEILFSNLKNYQLDSLETKLEEMHELECAADEKKLHMMRYLFQDFLPPIEREDIIELAQALDTILDNIEDIFIRMDMYQIESVHSNMLTLVELMEKASYKLSDITKELSNFKHPKKLSLLSEEIIALEEEADKIYYQSIKNLHLDKKDAFKSYRYSKIYDAFEECFDSFEDLADVVNAVILKNT